MNPKSSISRMMLCGLVSLSIHAVAGGAALAVRWRENSVVSPDLATAVPDAMAPLKDNPKADSSEPASDPTIAPPPSDQTTPPPISGGSLPQENPPPPKPAIEPSKPLTPKPPTERRKDDTPKMVKVDRPKPTPAVAPRSTRGSAADPPKERKVELGSDTGLPIATVAWIGYDDFQKLMAQRGSTEQPALQMTANPVKVGPIEFDATEAMPIGKDEGFGSKRGRGVEAAGAALKPASPTNTAPPSPADGSSARVDAPSPAPRTVTPAPLSISAVAPIVAPLPVTANPSKPSAFPAPVSTSVVNTVQPAVAKPMIAAPILSPAPSAVGQLPSEAKPSPEGKIPTPAVATPPPTPSIPVAAPTPAPPAPTAVANASPTPSTPATPTPSDPSKSVSSVSDLLALAMVTPAKSTDSASSPVTPTIPAAASPATPDAAKPATPAPSALTNNNSPAPANSNAAQTAAPSPVPGGGSGTTPRTTAAPRSDRESPPVSLTDGAKVMRPGSVLVGEGIEIKTAVPRIDPIAQISTIPSNPLVRVVFDAKGTVREAVMLKSSGSPNWDGPILASLYRWRATGKKLAEHNGPVVLEITILIID